MSRHTYFHGLPGSAAELSFLGKLEIQSPTVMHPADWAKMEHGADNTHGALIGFSLGAFAAIRAAAESGLTVRQLHLISPAAPLELSDVLDQMAGAPIFKAAQRHKHLLSVLSYGQRALASLAPQQMIKLTFATSPPADKALLENSDFRSACHAGIHASLVTDRKRYLATIHDYVRPWAQVIDELKCPVHIYQGSEDTWTPPAMAGSLAHRLGDRCTIEVFKGLGHYSTLHHCLPKILRDQHY